MEPGVEQADDGPALGEVAELAERAQVAQEGRRLGGVLEVEEGVEQGVRVRVRQSSGRGCIGSWPRGDVLTY